MLFFNCGFTQITSLAIIAPAASSLAFISFPAATPVYVPCCFLSHYQAGWSYFTNILCEGYTLTVLSGNTDNPRTVTLTQNSVFTANFAPNNTATLQQEITDLPNRVERQPDLANRYPGLLSHCNRLKRIAAATDSIVTGRQSRSAVPARRLPGLARHLSEQREFKQPAIVAHLADIPQSRIVQRHIIHRRRPPESRRQNRDIRHAGHAALHKNRLRSQDVHPYRSAFRRYLSLALGRTDRREVYREIDK